MSIATAIVMSVLSVCLASAWAAWLAFRHGEKSATVAELERRLERLEISDRNRPSGISPAQMAQLPQRMSIR